MKGKKDGGHLQFSKEKNAYRMHKFPFDLQQLQILVVLSTLDPPSDGNAYLKNSYIGGNLYPIKQTGLKLSSIQYVLSMQVFLFHVNFSTFFHGNGKTKGFNSFGFCSSNERRKPCNDVVDLLTIVGSPQNFALSYVSLDSHVYF